MTERLRWLLIVGSCALGLALLIQVPQVLHMLDPGFEGIPVQMNSDEEVYLARVEEALTGRPALTAEAFIGDPSLQGTQFALIEEWYGRAFAWTGWRAATVLQIMDSVVVFLLFTVLWMMLRLSGFTKGQALFGAVLFSILQLYNLNRPVHLAGSTLLTLTSLCGLLMGLRFHWIFGVAAGAILGTLVGVYVWSWMWAWAFLGTLMLVHGGWWLIERHRAHVDALIRLFVFALVGLVFALPHVWELWKLSRHPLYEQAVFRSGIHYGRAPESWAYSVLFVVMFGGVLAHAFTAKTQQARYIGAAASIATSFIVIHQQVIHGVIFNYVSHELLLLVITAISAVLLAWNERTRPLIVAALAAAVYLLAVGWDGRYVFKQFHPSEERFSQQNLHSILPMLDRLDRSRILSDRETSAFIAGFTHHDVVSSVYLKNILLSHKELAARYCLTLLPLPPARRHISEQRHLIYPDAVSAFDDDPSVREREVALVEEACRAIDRDPASSLTAYAVDFILWNEREQPQWDMSRVGYGWKEINSGSGWSLWGDAHSPEIAPP